MNLNPIRFAVAVAKEGTFSEAANRCFVTQPTLSNAVAQLEEELGHKLFERTTRSVSLTEFGEAILPKFEQLLAQSEGVKEFAKSWQASGQITIRIGLSPVVDMMTLQQRIEPFREANPEVEFYYQECYLDDLENRLKHGQLDVIMMPPREVRVEAQRTELYAEPLWYLPVPDKAKAGAESYELTDAAQHKLVLTVDVCGLRGVTQDLFRHHALSLNEYPGQATSYSVVEDWAKVGIGAGILPKSKISSSSSLAKPLLVEQTPVSIQCCAYSRLDDSYDELTQAFLSQLHA